MPVVVGKITSFKNTFSPYVGYSSLLSFQISDVLTREFNIRWTAMTWLFLMLEWPWLSYRQRKQCKQDVQCHAAAAPWETHPEAGTWMLTPSFSLVSWGNVRWLQAVELGLCRDKVKLWHFRSETIWNENFWGLVTLTGLQGTLQFYRVVFGCLDFVLKWSRLCLLIPSQGSLLSCDTEWWLVLAPCCRQGEEIGSSLILWVLWLLWYPSNGYRLHSFITINQ